MKVKSESEVVQSCPTPSDPMDCSLPGFSAHGIFQARVLEWGAIAFSDIAWITHIIYAEYKKIYLGCLWKENLSSSKRKKCQESKRKTLDTILKLVRYLMPGINLKINTH